MNFHVIPAEKAIMPINRRMMRKIGNGASGHVFTKKLFVPLLSEPVLIELPVAGLSTNPCQPALLALAHEVRNPLTNINLAVEMLESDLKDPDLKIYLEIISRSSLRINELLTRLLTYDDEVIVAAGSHSIHQILEEVLDLANDRIVLKMILVSKQFVSDDFKVICDRAQVKIALTNIVINAIEAMAPGKAELRLITTLVDGAYQLRIEDNGCGISKENCKKIFRPFYTSRPGGLGLGLSTTDSALRSNKIGMSVESEVGVGTSFVLRFGQKPID